MSGHDTMDLDIEDVMLEDLRPPLESISIILKIIEIGQLELNSQYNSKVRTAILGDSSGSIRAMFVRTGYNLQVADVILIKNAKIIQAEDNEFKMIINGNVELMVDTDIPHINEELIFDLNSLNGDHVAGDSMDVEVVELSEMDRTGARYNLMVQVVSEPKIKKKYDRYNYVYSSGMMVGDDSRRIPLIIRGLDALELEIGDVIELHGALLDYQRSEKDAGSELFLSINDYKKDVFFIRKSNTIYASSRMIRYLEPELDYIEEILDEKTQNLHLLAKIISMDEPFNIKTGDDFIQKTYARIGDPTGMVLLILLGEDATKFKRGDFIQILGGYMLVKNFERVIDIDSNGIIRHAEYIPEDFNVDYSNDVYKLTREEIEEIYDSLYFSTVDEIELESRNINTIVKVVKKILDKYGEDKNHRTYNLQIYLVGDQTARIYLKLYNNKIVLKSGDVLRLVKFYVSTWNVNVYLNKSRSGRLEVMDDDPIGEVSRDILMLEAEYTDIQDLREMETVNVKARIIEMGDEREFFDKEEKARRVMDAIIMDDTRSITLTLFDEKIDKIVGKEGETVEILNCYMKRYHSEYNLVLGYNALIRVIENEEDG